METSERQDWSMRENRPLKFSFASTAQFHHQCRQLAHGKDNLTSPVPPGSVSATLRSISPHQWGSGIAAWLAGRSTGWTLPSLHARRRAVRGGITRRIRDDRFARGALQFITRAHSCLVGRWVRIFGRIGDKLGRSRALSLTILTYALFTGLGFFATQWWHLMIFGFSPRWHRRRMGGGRIIARGNVARKWRRGSPPFSRPA